MSSKIDTNGWAEIRCAHCDDPKYEPRLLLKVTVEPLDEKQSEPSRKIGIETKCKDCYQFTYRTLVV